MEDTSTIATWFKTKETIEFQPVFLRMDEDLELWSMSPTPANLTEYEADIKTKTKAHTSDITVISNELRTFADDVQSILSSAEMQIQVRMAETEGEDKRDDIGKLERLFAFALEKGDERLRRLLLPPLRESLIWLSMVRGWTAGRFLVYKDKNNVIFDFLPLDPRWLVYEIGSEGLTKVGYKTFRTGASIESEYKVEAPRKKDNPVIDYWEREDEGKFGNCVVTGNTPLKEPEVYDLPSIPILIMPVSTRPPIADTTGMNTKGYGESIFAAARGITAVRNRFYSVAATHANLLANQPTINYYDEQGQILTSTAYLAEAVVNLPKGHNELAPSPMKEISPTVVQLLNWLDDQVARATLPKIPVGAPPPSGTLYNLAQQAGNKVFNPQLRNLNYFYADICRLIEEQLLEGKLKVKIKGEEKNKYYETQVTPVDLRKPHIIKVEFTATTPWTQLDTYQIADMAKRQGLPDEFIREYILKLPDPKGIGDLSAIEMAEHSPKLAMLRAIDAMMKAGRGEEAEQLMRDMYQMEMQEQMMMQGGISGEQPVPLPEAETPIRRIS